MNGDVVKDQSDAKQCYDGRITKSLTIFQLGEDLCNKLVNLEQFFESKTGITRKCKVYKVWNHTCMKELQIKCGHLHKGIEDFLQNKGKTHHGKGLA